MPTVEVTIKIAVSVDAIPPDITFGRDESGEVEAPIGGVEQIAYDVLEKLHPHLPDRSYAVVFDYALLQAVKLIPSELNG